MLVWQLEYERDQGRRFVLVGDGGSSSEVPEGPGRGGLHVRRPEERRGCRGTTRAPSMSTWGEMCPGEGGPHQEH